ncbi:MAG TPA: histidinol-phosphatase HisJ family protein [Campylobacterales bacterium]|nr:histidinol-phosphatase HisJ family protein [Campylobacterales bacterium]
MIVDLHNHTALCNHASGEMEEYVKQAIKNGTKYFGFSDHAPMDYDPKYRMMFSQMKEYEQSVKDLQEKYKDDINILLAYEVDYLENHMDKRVLNADVDYFIGSVHFIGKWGFDNPEFIGNYKHKDIDKIWQEYFDTIEALAKSGLFDIVGHLDLIKVFNFLPKKDVRLIAKDALKAIKKANMVIELNMSGLRKPTGEIYPSASLLESISELDIPITFSSDAHKPNQVGLYKDQLIPFAKKFYYDKCATFKNRDMQLIKF